MFKVTNIRGALVTMPHKKTTIELADEVSPTARIAGAANALLKREDGSLLADMFDGEGFVRGVSRKGRKLNHASALVIGSGGVGSAIAASLAAAGVTRMGLDDAMEGAAESLGERLSAHYPELKVSTGSADPTGYDLVVNATPLGMNEGDPLPIDMSLVAPTTFVGEVVMKSAVTPFLRAAQERGCEHSGWYGYVVRADPGVPGVLRVRYGDSRRVARRSANPVLTARLVAIRTSGRVQSASQRETPATDSRRRLPRADAATVNPSKAGEQ